MCVPFKAQFIQRSDLTSTLLSSLAHSSPRLDVFVIMSASLLALIIAFLLKTPNFESATLHLQKKSWYTSPSIYPRGMTHSVFPKLNFWSSLMNQLLFLYFPILLVDHPDLDFVIWKPSSHLELCLLLQPEKWLVINPINSPSEIKQPLHPIPSLQFRASSPFWATIVTS